MSRISLVELEKMAKSKFACTLKVNLSDPLLGDDKKHTMEFDVFDGLAYCANYKGKEYFMRFPKVSFIKVAKDMERSVRDYLGLSDTEPITEKHCMIAYNTLYTA